MPDAGSLRRLGGGRWQSRDGRFTVEPQSGTWVVVDGEQADDLGLPLVRGPFRSLGAAREAIEAARDQAPSSSPLAARVEEAAKRPARKVAPSRSAASRSGKPKGRQAATRSRHQPREPAWLTGLEPGQRRRAHGLIRRLEAASVTDAMKIARSEIVDDQPAVAKVAIEQRLASIVRRAKDPEAAARAVVEVVVGGRDAKLDVTWRLVDGDGRPIRHIEPTGR